MSTRNAIEELTFREHTIRYISSLQEYYERFKLEGTPEGSWIRQEITKVKTAYVSLPSASGAIASK